ncbi:MAG: family oxidoreductase [Novosphingobium sp.]|nr:family oxidoreductase [Novosphingobium sp.]
MTQPRKVAFVTGGSSGIGKAAATGFVENGYATVIADRDERLGREVEAMLKQHGECTFVSCDVTDDAAVKRAVDLAVATYGGLDAAFNAAGIDGEKGNATADCTLENWNRVMAIDLTGLWFCMRHQIPAMLASGGGSIVNCASVAGLVGAPFFPAYVAAKHGVVGLTKGAALEYARQGIRINAVCPGLIDTPMSRVGLTDEIQAMLVAEAPMGRLAQPEEVASAVLWLCDESSSYVTGQAIAVDGAWTTR